MISPKDILKQINKLTADIVGFGICDSQNFPSIRCFPGKVVKIGISDSECSIFLKSISYSDMFKQLEEKRIYNLKMIDGAMISMYYSFKNDQLISHRLSFFPSPDLEPFQNDPDTGQGNGYNPVIPFPHRTAVCKHLLTLHHNPVPARVS